MGHRIRTRMKRHADLLDGNQGGKKKPPGNGNGFDRVERRFFIFLSCGTHLLPSPSYVMFRLSGQLLRIWILTVEKVLNVENRSQRIASVLWFSTYKTPAVWHVDRMSVNRSAFWGWGMLNGLSGLAWPAPIRVGLGEEMFIQILVKGRVWGGSGFGLPWPIGI